MLRKKDNLKRKIGGCLCGSLRLESSRNGVSCAMNQSSCGFQFGNGKGVNKQIILIVDDNPTNLRLLSVMLVHQGYDVRKALNGEMALMAIASDLPDLILLDVRMPKMDGYELCRVIKADPAKADIPVIFISALDDPIDKVTAFSVGGVDYITKPFSEPEVMARVESQLRVQDLKQQLVARNQQLQLLNDELRRSNRELEQFAYIVSHDLQQPLQSITGYAKLLAMQYQSALEDVGLGYLSAIQTASDRMQRLIQDLLAFAQVSTTQMVWEQVDCNLLIQTITTNLAAAINQPGVTFSCAPLPKVVGNSTLLLQLFQNLVSNALKFARPGFPPQVDFRSECVGNQCQFCVQDNGIGILPEDQATVFEAFCRASNALNVQGSGIGLSICKKIVELHGGKIWLESQPGVGTRFFFTLPLAIAEDSPIAQQSPPESKLAAEGNHQVD